MVLRSGVSPVEVELLGVLELIRSAAAVVLVIIHRARVLITLLQDTVVFNGSNLA